jgi:hypothetical protein
LVENGDSYLKGRRYSKYVRLLPVGYTSLNWTVTIRYKTFLSNLSKPLQSVCHFAFATRCCVGGLDDELCFILFCNLTLSEQQMKEPGLDGRHRDKSGEIQQKRSDTLNKNLPNPIPQFSPNAKLETMRKETGKVSERDVREAAKSRK